jgi:uncharacterized protein YcnI
MRSLPLRSLAAAGATALLMIAGTGAASAHVHAHPDSTEAGESALITFETSHGCSGSPTTAITITLPEQITDATPTAKSGWTISKTTEDFAEPRVLDNGTSIGSRTSQVIFTATEPLPDGVRDTFQLSAKLPDAAGETLTFPVLQSCAEGETNWAELPADGQSDADLESPAPAFIITDGPGTDDSDSHGSGSSADRAADGREADDDRHNPVDEDDVEAAAVAGYAGLGAGVLGLILGAAALYRTRKA